MTSFVKEEMLQIVSKFSAFRIVEESLRNILQDSGCLELSSHLSHNLEQKTSKEDFNGVK